MSDSQNSELTPSVQTYIETVGIGLWGLVITGFLKDGRAAALASIDAIQDGKAFVETTVMFTKSGLSLDGQYCSHGHKTHLFSVTMRHPTGSNQAAAGG